MKNIIWVAIFVGILNACNPLEHGGIAPTASCRISPENGKTTDTFRFDASATQPGGLADKVYYRWDWNRDGIWDGEFSRLPVTGYRFYRKGC